MAYLFQVSTQTFGIHKALIHVRRYKLIRQRFLPEQYVDVISSNVYVRVHYVKWNIFYVYFP